MASRDGYKRELGGQVVYPEGLPLYIYPKQTKKPFYNKMCQKHIFFFISNLAKTERKSGSVFAEKTKINCKAESRIKDIISKLTHKS